MLCLIVDAAILIYANFNTVGHLCHQETGELTGLRFGFLRSIRAYERSEGAKRVFICFDTPGAVVKASEITEYKANRPWTETKEMMYSQVPALKEMLALTRYDQVEAPGYEADDVIAYLTKRITDQKAQVCILTSDDDLCQLTRLHRVYVRAPNRAKTLKDELWVKQNFGVQSSQLLLYRALAGDVSDNLPGVLKGKAQLESLQKMLLTHQITRLDEARKRAKGEYSTISRVLEDEENWETAKKNFDVMALHHPPTIKLTKGKRDTQGLEGLFERLQFKSLRGKAGEFT